MSGPSHIYFQCTYIHMYAYVPTYLMPDRCPFLFHDVQYIPCRLAHRQCVPALFFCHLFGCNATMLLIQPLAYMRPRAEGNALVEFQIDGLTDDDDELAVGFLPSSRHTSRTIVCGVPLCVCCHQCNTLVVVSMPVSTYSVAATGEHVLPLSVVKLGFVLRGHEFLVDLPGESSSIEDQEEARYDELKGTLTLLINHVSV